MSLIEQPPRYMENPGRSGAKLFVSYNRKLVIKSITSEEVALVHQILQPYHAVRIFAWTSIVILLFVYDNLTACCYY